MSIDSTKHNNARWLGGSFRVLFSTHIVTAHLSMLVVFATVASARKCGQEKKKKIKPFILNKRCAV